MSTYQERTPLIISAPEEETRSIAVPAFRTFRAALMNTTALQTISRRG